MRRTGREVARFRGVAPLLSNYRDGNSRDTLNNVSPVASIAGIGRRERDRIWPMMSIPMCRYPSGNRTR